ncbi:unnamed protein product [Arctogadus glacialis]
MNVGLTLWNHLPINPHFTTSAFNPPGPRAGLWVQDVPSDSGAAQGLLNSTDVFRHENVRGWSADDAACEELLNASRGGSIPGIVSGETRSLASPNVGRSHMCPSERSGGKRVNYHDNRKGGGDSAPPPPYDTPGDDFHIPLNNARL